MEAEFEAERIREEEREAERLAQRQKLQEEQLKERQQKVFGNTIMFIKFFQISMHLAYIFIGLHVIILGMIIAFALQCFNIFVFVWSYPLSLGR